MIHSEEGWISGYLGTVNKYHGAGGKSLLQRLLSKRPDISNAERKEILEEYESKYAFQYHDLEHTKSHRFHMPETGGIFKTKKKLLP